MPFNPLMIKYEPDRLPVQPMSEFLLIWRVEADDTYRNHVRRVGQIPEPVLFFTWEGHGVCKLFDDGHEREYHLKAHTLLFLDKHTRLQYHGCEGCHWKFFYIRFTNLNIVQDLQLKQEVLYSTKQTPYLMNICEKMIQCLVQKNTAQAYRVNGMFYDLMSALSLEHSSDHEKRNAQIHQVIYWMHQNLDKPIKTHELVLLSKMSRSKFFQMFQAATGSSPTAYILQLKLTSASLALETTNQTVKAIAESLSFCDAYYFSSQFKKHFGMSPTEYRRKRE